MDTLACQVLKQQEKKPWARLVGGVVVGEE